MKKIFLTLLAAVMFPLMASAADDDIASGKCGTCNWVIDKDGVLTIYEGTLANWEPTAEQKAAENYDARYYYPNWMGKAFTVEQEGHELVIYSHAADIKAVRFEGAVKATTCFNMFSSLYNMTDIDLFGLNTEGVTNMYNMFFEDGSLTSLDLTPLNTDSVTDMTAMVAGCTHLSELDLTNFNTSKVTNYGSFINMTGFAADGGLNINIWNENPKIFTDGESTIYGKNFFTDYSGFSELSVEEAEIYNSRITRTVHFPLNMKADEYHKTVSSIDGITKTVSDLQLTDGKPYTRKHDLANCRIPYVRNPKNDNWQALYVPFAVNCASTDYQIASIDELKNYGDEGYVDPEDPAVGRSYVVATVHLTGYTTPNQPYFIKFNKYGIGDQVIYARDAEYVDHEQGTTMCANDENTTVIDGMTFMSTYAGLTNGEMYNNDYYALTAGQLKKASGASVSLGTYRWYVDIPSSSDAKALSIHFSDGTETSISSAELNNEPSGEVTYNLRGQRVSGNLMPGIYVRDGKKFMVK